MASKAPPKTSKRPYPDPTPGGTPTCTERFPILLVHTIASEHLAISSYCLALNCRFQNLGFTVCRLASSRQLSQRWRVVVFQESVTAIDK
jgi:hypothetical protein